MCTRKNSQDATHAKNFWILGRPGPHEIVQSSTSEKSLLTIRSGLTWGGAICAPPLRYFVSFAWLRRPCVTLSRWACVVTARPINAGTVSPAF